MEATEFNRRPWRRYVKFTIAGIALLSSPVHYPRAVEPAFSLLAYPNGQPVTDFPTPYAVSTDRAVVVGQFGLYEPEAFRWTASDGLVGLGFLAALENGNESSANGVSADGKVIVGSSSSTNTYEGFRWDLYTKLGNNGADAPIVILQDGGKCRKYR
jgi:hypothetical protein